jgi:hypothetical protein
MDALLEDTIFRIQQLPGAADLFGLGMLVALLGRLGWTTAIVERRSARWLLSIGSVTLIVFALGIYHENIDTY